MTCVIKVDYATSDNANDMQDLLTIGPEPDKLILVKDQTNTVENGIKKQSNDSILAVPGIDSSCLFLVKKGKFAGTIWTTRDSKVFNKQNIQVPIVDVASTQNVDVNNSGMIDGTSTYTFVLLKNQILSYENGIYENNNSKLRKLQDIVKSGTFVYVQTGLTNGNTLWKTTTFGSLVTNFTQVNDIEIPAPVAPITAVAVSGGSGGSCNEDLLWCNEEIFLKKVFFSISITFGIIISICLFIGWMKERRKPRMWVF
jgi:hypothetical protein